MLVLCRYVLWVRGQINFGVSGLKCAFWAKTLAGVAMGDPVIVSGAAIQTRPLPLACVVLIGLGPLASIPLTLMAV